MNGCRKLGWRPIILAASHGNTNVTDVLIKHGADPDLPAPREIPWVYSCGCKVKTRRCKSKMRRGTRPLHCAVYFQHLGTIKALLRAGADPNVADCAGNTSLMAACELNPPNMKVVKELLEAGASPAQTSKRGDVALFLAASFGSTALVGMLLSRAPELLNHAGLDGQMTLYCASMSGNEDVVAFLLAAGAQQPTYEEDVCPLNASVQEGRVETVRMLLDIGREAIGGAVAIPAALATAVHHGRAGILQMMVDIAPVERRPLNSPRCSRGDRPLVCCAVINRGFATLSVLFAVGADATATDSKGKCAQDFVHTVDGTPATKQAFRRMLERAPAFRCRLWDWPADVANIGGACASSSVDVVVFWSGEPRAPLGVRIFRPKHRKLFARVLSAGGFSIASYVFKTVLNDVAGTKCYDEQP